MSQRRFVTPAPYACDAARSRGRLYSEEESATRSPFQRDRDRIIHSTAFRRLKHKTQVFVYHEGDHYRTRLTHSLEVAQIARSLCRALGLDDDLSEAVALAHDLGHTPFGHAGERALSECMAAFDGFDHNAQTLRIVTKLEQRYAAFNGLNLTWESLEGIVKHNGPLTGKNIGGEEKLPLALREYVALHNLQLDSYASAEAQIAAIADDIAYNNHDIDDGIRAGLFSLADIRDVPVVDETVKRVLNLYPGLEGQRLVHETLRRLIDRMIADVLAETGRRAAQYKPASADDVRNLSAPLVGFSEDMVAHDAALKKFLQANMYGHFKVMRVMTKAQNVVKDLFGLLVARPDLLPPEWSRNCVGPRQPKTARVVCDFIAGMTDGFALEEHRRLFPFEARF
jgi:dGTPase